jgi:hypothetical protein
MSNRVSCYHTPGFFVLSNLGFTYRQVQSMTGHKDIRMVVRYDHERGNLEENAINFLHYDEN